MPLVSKFPSCLIPKPFVLEFVDMLLAFQAYRYHYIPPTPSLYLSLLSVSCLTAYTYVVISFAVQL